MHNSRLRDGLVLMAAIYFTEVKNPIGLARLILDESTKPLSLARVPPNLLVGPSASDYAYEKGVTVLPNEYLISDSARERWKRWRDDLRAAGEQEFHDERNNLRRYSDYDAVDHRGDTPHAFSPPTSPSYLGTRPNLSQLPTPARPLVASTADLSDLYSTTLGSGAHPAEFPLEPTKLAMHPGFGEDTNVGIDDDIPWSTNKRPRIDGSLDSGIDESGTDESLEQLSQIGQMSLSTRRNGSQDHITDTVGAIAVDCSGNIAAGSSSGGIGMKHRGRTGPAALVGIGTAVIPVDPLDKEKVCVATVTSGTGEHMATTMAAATCANRIYSGMRKVPGGALIKCSEEDAMKNMIKEEFMNHPGVKDSHCPGAIGIMAVKKTRDGVFLYFGHNTDSFALASMHSEEKKPVCTMSRNTGNSAIALGGRAARYKRGGY